MITYRNAYLNTVGTLLHLRLGIGDRYLWTLPMFHANGWTFAWTVRAVASTHICLPKPDPGEVFRLIREEHVTWLCTAPTVLISLANAPANLRGDVSREVHVVTAAGPPAAATIERLEAELGWEVTQVYGLTETSPFVSVCDPLPEHGALTPAERATIKVRQGVELITSGDLRVVDTETGQEVPHDCSTIGEIVVRGNVVLKGYYRDPEATDKAIRNGRFHSGDAAVVRPDGYAEIRDRRKDVIISGSGNIPSVAVKDCILRHPAVQEVAVVGLPDERWGEAPCAFGILKTGQTATETELREFARARLAHYKVPQLFNFVEELPKTATGKIQKFVLRGRAPAIVRQ